MRSPQLSAGPVGGAVSSRVISEGPWRLGCVDPVQPPAQGVLALSSLLRVSLPSWAATHLSCSFKPHTRQGDCTPQISHPPSQHGPDWNQGRS